MEQSFRSSTRPHTVLPAKKAEEEIMDDNTIIDHPYLNQKYPRRQPLTLQDVLAYEKKFIRQMGEEGFTVYVPNVLRNRRKCGNMIIRYHGRQPMVLPEDIAILDQINSITAVNCSSFPISIKYVQRLNKVRLHSCNGFQIPVKSSIACCPIKSLEFIDCDTGTIRQFSDLHQVQYLEIRKEKQSTVNDGLFLSVGMYSALSECSYKDKLLTIDLSSWNLSDTRLSSTVSDLTQLFPNLVSLLLRNNKITSTSVQHLTQLVDTQRRNGYPKFASKLRYIILEKNPVLETRSGLNSIIELIYALPNIVTVGWLSKVNKKENHPEYETLKLKLIACLNQPAVRWMVPKEVITTVETETKTPTTPTTPTTKDTASTFKTSIPLSAWSEIIHRQGIRKPIYTKSGGPTPSTTNVGWRTSSAETKEWQASGIFELLKVGLAQQNLGLHVAGQTANYKEPQPKYTMVKAVLLDQPAQSKNLTKPSVEPPLQIQSNSISTNIKSNNTQHEVRAQLISKCNCRCM